MLWPYIADTNLLAKFGGREYAEVDGRLYGKDPGSDTCKTIFNFLNE